MQIFKTYFIIMKKKAPTLIILLVTYFGMSIFYSSVGSSNDIESFENINARIAIFNYDVIQEYNSELSEGLKNYLSQHMEIISLDDDKDRLQEALFFNEVHSVVKIPQDFSMSFVEGKNVTIEKMSIPNSIEAIYVQMHLNKFLNKAKVYFDNIDGINQSQLVEIVNDDLSKSIKVEFLVSEPIEAINVTNHYNLMSVYLLFIMLNGVGINMMAFNKGGIIKRNSCSPISITRRNIQLVLGNLTFTVFCWGLGILGSIIFLKDQFVLSNTILFGVNSFIFALTCLSIAFFIGNSIRKKEAFHSITTVLVLGMCFISGVFIPLEVMSANVIKIAKFMPLYWYVKTNRDIENITLYSINELMPIISQMLIIVSFGIGILSFAMLISKIKFSRVTKN